MSTGPTGTAPIPIIPMPQSTATPASPMAPVPVPQLRPRRVAMEQPAPPSPVAPSLARRPRPKRAKAFFAVTAVAGLALVTVLPFFGIAPAHAHTIATVTDGDDQHMQISNDAVPAAVSIDTIKDVATTGAAGGWHFPVVGTLGDPFGPRPDQPVAGVNLFHRGQDIVAACGTTIHAAAAGTVVYAGWYGTYGNWILIDHGNGIETGYAHAEQIDVFVGQKVKEDQELGLVGETGAATGCHLHFEVHINDVAVNPVPFFAAKHVPLAG